ncbi:neutral zinc metallopeptidase [Nocardia sp. CDC159]|uniref:Neutral zinc metallopeptidase n=1 Tax=Nocardia pulmonis TaxID=2951408 RepID=A0A9X2E5R1_9NOCA|nr:MULTISPECIES: neutral zinc metallopeptidase [Nocardia]MCM6774734.1 neutral zinc metallopeptidase [Nocardia pulmonis]MCM6787201.1 neutral zinc metallopeptidase [Nocardia sp. CDC159]
MTFNEGMDIDPERVSTGGGMGPKMVLGGGGGLIVLVLALLFGVNPGDVVGNLTGGENKGQSGAVDVSVCKTNSDANRYAQCRVVLTAQSLDGVWGGQLPQQTSRRYIRPEVKLFTGAIGTGCGNATSAVGPFYCPADRTTYFDTAFFQELRDKFGASGGPLAEEYVVAHEFGHHIQNLLGDSGRAQRDPKGPESGSVRLELQADCYAGIWASYAAKTPAPGGSQPLLKPLTDKDIQDALSAAAAVGDDRIQKKATGRVNPEGWTHGSSAERQQWFLAGYRTGQVRACDTFNAADLNNPPALR